MIFYIVRARLDKAPEDYWSHFEVFNVIFLEVCSDTQLFPVLSLTQVLSNLLNCIQCICCLS